MKRFIAVLLAIGIILSLAMPAFAAESRTFQTPDGIVNSTVYIFDFEKGREASPTLYNEYFAARATSNGVINDYINGKVVYCVLDTYKIPLTNIYVADAYMEGEIAYNFINATARIYMDVAETNLVAVKSDPQAYKLSSYAQAVYSSLTKPAVATGAYGAEFSGTLFTLNGFLRASW